MQQYPASRWGRPSPRVGARRSSTRTLKRVAFEPLHNIIKGGAQYSSSTHQAKL